MVGLRQLSDAAPLTPHHNHPYSIPTCQRNPPAKYPFYLPPPPQTYTPHSYEQRGQVFDGRDRQAFAGAEGGRVYHVEARQEEGQEEAYRRAYHRNSWGKSSFSGGLYPTPPPREWQFSQVNTGNWYGLQNHQYSAPQQHSWTPYPQPLTQSYYAAALTQQSALPPSSQQFNPNASAFTPVNPEAFESVAKNLLFKRLGINKTTRYSQASPGPVPAAPSIEKKKKKEWTPERTEAWEQKKLQRRLAKLARAEQKQNEASVPDRWTRAPVPEVFSDLRGLENQLQVILPQSNQQKTTRAKKGDPRAIKRVKIMEQPIPTSQYLHYATQPAQTTDVSRPLLVILDLNGTLLWRKKLGGSNAFVPRPHVYEFIQYLFSNHTVMVWSSSKPENVAKMCSNLFTPQQQAKLAAVWGRDTLKIPDQHYNSRVQVYKQLSWVWSDAKIQASNPVPDDSWSQLNTVLIDDTIEKAAGEPYNLIELEEFEAKEEQMNTDHLGQVALYLDDLRSQRDVSAYMRLDPFVYNPLPPAKARGQKRDTPMEDMLMEDQPMELESEEVGKIN